MIRMEGGNIFGELYKRIFLFLYKCTWATSRALNTGLSVSMSLMERTNRDRRMLESLETSSLGNYFQISRSIIPWSFFLLAALNSGQCDR